MRACSQIAERRLIFCKGTKIISNHQIKSQIFSNFFSSCKKWHIAKLYEPQSSNTNFLYIFKPSRAGQPPYPPHTCTKGSSMYILHAYDYWCRRRHVIMSSCHHAVKKKSVLGGQRNSIYNINIIYTISLDPLSPIFPKSLSAWWHDDIMTWWHDGETQKKHLKMFNLFLPKKQVIGWYLYWS